MKQRRRCSMLRRPRCVQRAVDLLRSRVVGVRRLGMRSKRRTTPLQTGRRDTGTSKVERLAVDIRHGPPSLFVPVHLNRSAWFCLDLATAGSLHCASVPCAAKGWIDLDALLPKLAASRHRYSLAGVLGAPPFVSQLAILATSSIPCSLGLPSSFVRPNRLAF